MSASSNGEERFVGVDVGGTKVAAGTVTSAGQIVHHLRVPMNARGSAEDGLASVLAAIDSILVQEDKSIIRGIGICAPGPLDPQSGVILNPPNVPCWRNFPLAAEVRKRYGVTVKVDNDGKAAALAEALWGAGRGYRNIFYATVGTGIGSGFVQDGRLYYGRTGAAFEGGHVSIDLNGPVCNCGKKGCIEVLASGTAIGRRARARVAAEPVRAHALLALAVGNPEQIRSELVGKAAAAGDLLAKEVLDETVQFLAVWLGNIVDLLEPDVIILGGGVSETLCPFFSDLQDRMAPWCINARYKEIPIALAHYGAHSGIAGGAALLHSPQ